MVQSVSYLQIQPLQRCKAGVKGTTTLLPFEDMLDSEQAASGVQSSAQSAGAAADEQSETAQLSSAGEETADQKVVYRDPVTGKNIIYVDVAGKSEGTDSVSSSKTTTASSMKKTKYDAYFKKAAKRYGVSESLLKAIAKAESNFNAKDVSSAGAVGVMQLMPGTAKSLGVKDIYDPEQNIMGGAKCIKQKLKEFNGNVRLALAAYNAGSGAVKRNGGVPSYCKSYINKVLSYKKAYETAAAVG